mmetsp:Transcript_28320/g.80849  ORF Transcript_28320/g.80849 Transcript_28320/m.80849 type:complete len:250 (+) Transcript_28320:1334-2083(+)
MASPSARLARRRRTVSVARSPSAMSFSSSTSTVHVSSMRGAWWQKACTSRPCSGVSPSCFTRAAAPPGATSSCSDGAGPRGSLLLSTCGTCSSGESPGSRAWTRQRRKHRIPRRASSRSARSPSPRAATEAMARPSRGACRSSAVSSACTSGAMRSCRRRMWAHRSVAWRRMGGSLNGHGAQGSMTVRHFRGNSLLSGGGGFCPGAGRTSGSRSTLQARSPTVRTWPRRPGSCAPPVTSTTVPSCSGIG